MTQYDCDHDVNVARRSGEGQGVTCHGVIVAWFIGLIKREKHMCLCNQKRCCCNTMVACATATVFNTIDNTFHCFHPAWMFRSVATCCYL